MYISNMPSILLDLSIPLLLMLVVQGLISEQVVSQSANSSSILMDSLNPLGLWRVRDKEGIVGPPALYLMQGSIAVGPQVEQVIWGLEMMRMVFELFHSVTLSAFPTRMVGGCILSPESDGSTAIEEALQIVSDDGWYEENKEDLYE